MKIRRFTFYGPHQHPQVRIEEGEPGVTLIRLYDPDDPKYRRRNSAFDPWKGNPIGKQPVLSVCIPVVQGMSREEASTEATSVLEQWFKERA